jgi:2-polyprenyl-6-methoxyphenol hydroxylase-like FAD-dependent oxidoreductase
MAELECEVLVVGAGPAGVVTALLLGDLGVDTVVVDRRTEVSDLPRARGIHARATEVLRQLGIEDDMVAASLPIDPRMEVRTSLGAPPVHTAPTGGDSFSEVSPCEGIAIAQDVFEGVLREHLGRRDGIRVRLGQRLVGLDAEGERGAVASLVEESGASHTIRAAYVVGADGWRSPVRGLAGIGFADEPMQTMRSIRFRADLSPWLGTPPPSFVRIVDPDSALLATHPDGRWVVFVLSPDEEPAEALVRRALGVDADVEVLADVFWEAGIGCAERFRSGPVFLVGDAAHRVTPLGATGITTAMSDAHNLAWKLAGVLRGWAPPSLLDTYSLERRPVAELACAHNRALVEGARTGRPPAGDQRMVDMGYRYASPIITADPANAGPLPDAYVQTADPGARAPHAWIDRTTRHSTIDLFGRSFVLLASTATAGPGHPTVRAEHGIPLEAFVTDVPEVLATYRLDPGSLVLVRPDGHVAWRSSSGERASAPSLADVVAAAAGWSTTEP